MPPGKRLKAFREDRGLTRTAFAAQIGCHQSYVSLLEAGKRRPGLELAHVIAYVTKRSKQGQIKPQEWFVSSMQEALS